ncbi:MAG TPA: hypothetical protein EYP29_05815 [Thermoplasmata archaeon]|nr:hypothetical protein [Thermoplasmata archaeon]
MGIPKKKAKEEKRKEGKKDSSGGIPDRVSIHQRPKVIDRRKQIGHWEGDSLIGKSHTNGLHTEYERVSSLTRLEKIARINAEETLKA